LEKRLKVRAFKAALNSYWLDLGTPANYLKANLDACGARGRRLGPRCRLAKDAKVRHSVLGAGCVVEAKAEIIGSVLWSGCRIGKGARIKGSLLGRDVKVGEGARLVPGTVLGDGARVGL
jgi:NDP-sugar pyrophosphorylase family protein